MNVDALNGEDRLVRGERLILEFTQVGAVERVGAQRAEAVEIEQRRALADLLVGGKRDLERWSRELRMCRQMPYGSHDLGDAGLVIGTEQRVTGRGDDVVAALSL